MAFGVISSFANQRVTIGTEIALDINISGNPDHAYIEGLLEGFYTDWEDPVLKVRGAAKRLVNNVSFTVKALKGTNAPLSRSGVISVVPAAPVITDPGRQKLVRGIENSFTVDISNSPSNVSAVGPWVGMQMETQPGGVRIFGKVPEVTHAIPAAKRSIRLTAASGALRDTLDIPFDFHNRIIYSADNRDDIYRLQLSDTDLSVSSDLKFDTNISQIRYLASDTGFIYYGSIAERRRVYKVSRTTGNGQSVNGTHIARYQYNGGGIVIDGNNAYRAEEGPTGAQIRVFNKSTGATIRTFRLDIYRWARGLAIDGDDLIVCMVRSGITGQHLRWYNKNTLNGRIATHTKQVSLPTTSRQYEDITFFDKKLFVANSTNKTITVLDVRTGNVLTTYTLPSTFNGMYGITIFVG